MRGGSGTYSRTLADGLGLRSSWRMVTAVVIKYVDNIMKGFATSLSIVISITVPFVVGSSIVLATTWFYNQPAQEKPKEVAQENLDGDDGAGMRISLSSLSLKGGGRKSANVPGSPIDSSQPILGDMNPKKKSPLPTPGLHRLSFKPFIQRSRRILPRRDWRSKLNAFQPNWFSGLALYF
ncbi:hypothetical protein FRC04_009192 [Tulasnella sp. 424]|nr:hypothetical protein FRC04_009192 [Tulasnella sp. 424]